MTTLGNAWAARASSPVMMMHVGDSVTEGTGAAGFENKYTTKLLRSLQTDAGIAGGGGYVNSGSYSTTSGLAEFYSIVPSVNTGGFIGNRQGDLAVNTIETITFTGTSIDVHFFKGFSSAQNYSATLDGVNVGPIVVPTTGGQNMQGRWHSPIVSAGTHTLTLTPASGQQLYLRGIFVYNGDEAKGVHGYEGGHFGTTSTDQAGATSGYFTDACAVIQPAVVTMFLGLNDLTTPTVPATYQSNLSSIITAVNALCTIAPSWVICSPYARPDTPSPTYPLSQYTAAAQAVVNADTTNRRFVDLNLAGLVNGTDFFDGVHPNAGGHTKLAAAIRPAIVNLAGAVTTGGGNWASLIAERWNGTSWDQLTAEEWNGTTWASTVIERAS